MSGISLDAALAGHVIRSDHVKIVQSGLNSLSDFGKEAKSQFDPDELKRAVSRVHRTGRRVMVHANGREPVKTAIAAGCDSVEHGFFMGRENLEALAERGIFWVPTVVTMKAFAELEFGVKRDVARRNLEHQLEQIRLAREFG